MATLSTVTMALLVAGNSPAAANGGIAMAVDVMTSSQTVQPGPDGACTWDVSSDIVVVNLTSQPITVSGVSYSVSWTAPSGASGVQNNITVLDNGGLEAGFTLGPDERRTFSPLVLQFTVPCDADDGDLAVRLTSPAGTGSGDAPFLAQGTAVPPGAFGMAMLALPVAAGLIVLQQRRKNRAAMAPSNGVPTA